jgi:hypothetical protein
VRIAIGKLLAATLLTVCVAVQTLEATGHWDRTFQDSGDEAIVVAVVLCIGAALLAAAAIRRRLSPTIIPLAIVAVTTASLSVFLSRIGCSALDPSPPLSLRI